MGPKSLQTNTAEWVGGTQLKAACRQAAGSQVADCEERSHLKWQEQRTYAAVAAAGVEPSGRLSSEDGDAAADRVAVVRLCQNSAGESCFTKRTLLRVVSDVWVSRPPAR